MAFGGVLVLLVFLLAALQGGGMVEAKACEGKDLDAYSDLRVGNKLKKECSSFNRAKRGQWARIFYKESFYSNCTQIRELGSPDGFVFQIGGVRGGMTALHSGVVGMCVGEKRRITAPANHSYGELAAYDAESDVWIPPNSTIVFDVELVFLTEEDEVPPDYMTKLFEHSAKGVVTKDDHIGAAAASELEFHRHVMTLELSSTYASSKGIAYFQTLYDDRVKYFEIAKANRKKKGMEYKETDPWIEKMRVFLKEMRDGAGKEL